MDSGAQLTKYQMWIGREWQEPASGGYFECDNAKLYAEMSAQTRSVWISLATEVPNPFILR